MASSSNLEKSDSLEDFEFFDAEGDLDIDLTKSPIHDAAKKLNSGLSLIIAALITVVEDQGLIISVPLQAVAATAAGALTGSLLGGPPGFAIGLLTGAVIAYRTSPNRSKSPESGMTKSTIRQIFNQMTLQQKKELIIELLRCLKHSNARKLIVEILKNEEVRKVALNILSSFLMKKMGVCLTRSN